MKAQETSTTVSSTITNMILWMILPSAITNFLLKRYYSFKYARNSPNLPKPNSPKFKRHYKICYTFVIGMYFLYCIAQSIYSLEPSYYSKIGIVRSKVRTDLKRRGRQLLLMYHPDKSTNGQGDMNKYIELKSMVDVIENENTCNVYEKFGHSGIETIRQASQKKNFANSHEIHKDNIYNTMFDWIMFYSGVFFTLLVLGVTSKNQSGQFWRFLGLLLLASYESYLYFVDFTTVETISQESAFSWTRPWTLVSLLLSFVPIYQRVKILRQIYIYSGFAISQLGPIWSPAVNDISKDRKALVKELEGIHKLTSSEMMQESSFVFNSAFGPFKENEEMRSLLKKQMGQVAVDLRVLESMKEADLNEIRKKK